MVRGPEIDDGAPTDDVGPGDALVLVLRRRRVSCIGLHATTTTTTSSSGNHPGSRGWQDSRCLR